eukprot:PhF_6_TR40172/c1_g1_i5/m.59538
MEDADTDGCHESSEEEEEDESFPLVEEDSTSTFHPACTTTSSSNVCLPPTNGGSLLWMRPSLFATHRGPTVHFSTPYDPSTEPTPNTTQIGFPASYRMKFFIKKNARRAILHKTMSAAGMVETMKKTDKKVNLFWGMRLSDTQFQSLNAYQKVNHYPGTYYLGRKDHLLRGLARMRRQFGSSLFDFFPTTFFLPRDVSMLKSEMNRTVPTGGKKHIYIAKPPASSCG